MSHQDHPRSEAVPGERPGPLRGLLLDVGGDIGALVVTTDAALDGREIEVSPLGRDDARTHTVVHAHAAGEQGAATVFAAVFVALPAGRYTLWRPEGGAWADVSVDGGRVAELDLRLRPAAVS